MKVDLRSKKHGNFQNEILFDLPLLEGRGSVQFKVKVSFKDDYLKIVDTIKNNDIASSISKSDGDDSALQDNIMLVDMNRLNMPIDLFEENNNTSGISGTVSELQNSNQLDAILLNLNADLEFRIDSRRTSRALSAVPVSCVNLQDIMPALAQLETQRSEQEINEKKNKKLQCIQSEFLLTEKRYVSRMETALQVFYLPLQAGTIIDKSVARDQFRDIEVIYGIHKQLLHDLEALPSNDKICEIFLNYIPFLKAYKSYLEKYEDRMKIRADLEIKNNKFRLFLQDAVLNIVCKGHSLESFLVEPAQRIPRYKLLFEQVLHFNNIIIIYFIWMRLYFW